MKVFVAPITKTFAGKSIFLGNLGSPKGRKSYVYEGKSQKWEPHFI